MPDTIPLWNLLSSPILFGVGSKLGLPLSWKNTYSSVSGEIFGPKRDEVPMDYSKVQNE
jgi:hypothetical protein